LSLLVINPDTPFDKDWIFLCFVSSSVILIITLISSVWWVVHGYDSWLRVMLSLSIILLDFLFTV
jgi:hypothetical protein